MSFDFILIFLFPPKIIVVYRVGSVVVEIRGQEFKSLPCPYFLFNQKKKKKRKERVGEGGGGGGWKRVGGRDGGEGDRGGP